MWEESKEEVKDAAQNQLFWKQFAEIGRGRRCATESYDSTFELGNEL